MKKPLFMACALSAFALAAASGQESRFEPSPLVRGIVEAEVRIRTGESEAAFAQRRFAAELRTETALRLGCTLQEARLRLRREIRLEAALGAENGMRTAARLERAEKGRAGSGGKTSAASSSGASSSRGRNGGGSGR